MKDSKTFVQSNMNIRTIQAYTQGYYVTKDGQCISKTGYKLKPYINSKGYIEFKFSDGFGYTCNLRVHKLQAYQKYGVVAFQKGIQVRHLNGNSLDNSWENIGIGTAKENQLDIPQNVRKDRARKANLMQSYTALDNNKTVFDLIRFGNPLLDISCYTGISISTIQNMVSSNAYKIYTQDKEVFPTRSKPWKLTNRSQEQKYEIYDALIAGESYSSISKRLGVAKSTLSCMKNKSQEFKDYKNKC